MRKKSMAVAVAIALTAGTVMPQMTLADSFAQEAVQELDVQADFSEGESADDSGFEIEEADGDENAPDVEVDGEMDSEEDNAGSEEQQEDSQIFSSEDAADLDDGSMQTAEFSDGDNEEKLEYAGELSIDSAGNGLYADENGESDNTNEQNYTTWSSPMYSYLTKEDDGYYRVECVNSKLLIEKYDLDFVRQSSRIMEPELEKFGGFYAGKNAYYVVWGQKNPDDDPDKEVIRLVKYDKNWNRLGAASLIGADTYDPFTAGSLRMAEYGNVLYIRTAHELFAGTSGVHHQCNQTWQVRTTDMTTIEINNGDWLEGYVSHSFNQFILVDDQANIVAMDHGDAYPRGICLGMYEKTASEDSFKSPFYREMVLEAYDADCNATGMAVGGLEYSSSSYLTAGNSVVQDENWSEHTARNIFVTSTLRSDCTKTPVRVDNEAENSYTIKHPLTLNKTTSFKWITGYSEADGITASTPQLVKLGNDLFLLLWAQMEGYYSNGKISYVFLDGNGNMTSQIYTKDGYLSDCQSIERNGKAIWYITDRKQMTVCSVSPDGTFQTEPAHKNSYEPEVKFARDEVKCGLIESCIENPLTTNSDGIVSYSSSDENVAKVDADGKVMLISTGTCMITANVSAGVDYAAKSVSYTLHVLNLKKQTISGKNSVTCFYGDDPFKLDVSCEGNAELNYVSDDPKTISVSKDGNIIIRSVGSTIIHVTADATEEYAGAELKVTVTVAPKDISKGKLIFTKTGDIALDTSDSDVAFVIGNKVLTKNTDYSLSGRSYRYYSYDQLYSFECTVEGMGNYTGTVYMDINPISAKSRMLSAVWGSTGNELTWKEETGALGYYIYRKTDDESKYRQIKKITSINITTWTDAERDGNIGTYTYCVRAYTRNGEKEVLANTSNAISCGSPGPVLKKAVSQNGNAVKVTWEPMQGVDSYILYYKTGNTGWKEVAKDIKNTEYVHSGLTLGEEYTYTVRGALGNKKTAYDKAGVSVNVSPAEVKLGKVVSAGYNRVNITWTKMNGVSGYVIYVKQSGKWVKLAQTTGTSYLHSNTRKFPVVTGRANTYTVRAFCRKNNKIIYGSYSSKGITGKAMPGKTTISSLRSSKRAFTVSYKKVEASSGYQIAYSRYRNKGYRYIVVGNSKLSTMVQKLASKKNYFVKVRAYRNVGKNRYYGDFSPIKTVKTK